MSKPSVTYQQLIDIVYTYICNTCANIDAKYDSLNNCFKYENWDGGIKWVSDKTKISGDGRAAYSTWYRYEIINGTQIDRITASTVGTDLNNLLSNRGITNRNETVPATDLLNVINNLTSFCVSNIWFAKSPFYNSGNSGVIYYKSNNGCPNAKSRTTPTSESHLVTANEIRGTMTGTTVNKDGLFDMVTTYLKSNSYRNGNPRYKVTFWNS